MSGKQIHLHNQMKCHERNLVCGMSGFNMVVVPLWRLEGRYTRIIFFVFNPLKKDKDIPVWCLFY